MASMLFLGSILFGVFWLPKQDFRSWLLQSSSKNSESLGAELPRKVLRAHGAQERGAMGGISTGELINRFKETYSMSIPASEKNMKCAELIRLLSARVGVGETIRVVDGIVGRGSDRTFFVGEAFRASSEDFEFLVSEVARNKADPDYQMAYVGIFSQALETRGLDEFVKLMSCDIPPETSSSLWASISVYVGPNQESSVGLRRFEELRNLADKVPPRMKSLFVDALIRAGSKYHPFSAWEGLVGFKNEFDSTGEQVKWNKLAAKVAKEMTDEDPARALSLIEKQGAFAGRGEVLQTAMSSWARVNYDSALVWFNEKSVGMSPDVADGIKSVFLSSVMGRGEVEEAQLWFKQISNEELRADASLELGKLTAGKDLKKALDFSESLKGKERDDYVIGVMSAARPDQVGDVTRLISSESPSESTMSSAKYRNQVATAAKQYAELSIENAREWVSALPESKQIPAVRGMTAVWARKAPDELAAWLNTLPNGEVRNMGVQSLVDAIKKDDPATAEQWIQSMNRQR